MEHPGQVASRRQRVRRSTVEEILDNARALLTRGSPTAVTMRAIAREMGMAPAALYRYFPHLDALLSALCARLYDESRTVVTRVPAADRGAALRRWALAHPHEYTVMFGRRVAGDEARAAERALKEELGGRTAAPAIGLVLLEVLGHLEPHERPSRATCKDLVP